jgi:HAD superfamily hydrolase (TIGR01549 family)
MSSAFSTVIFDYDGVFVLDEYRGIRALCPDEVAVENIEKKYYDKTDDAKLWNELRDHFSISETDAELIAAYNREDELQRKHKEEMFSLASELSKQFTIALLSNQFQSRTNHLRTTENFESFSSVCFSSEIGMKKPDPEIFDTVLLTLSPEASVCLYLDDAAENIEAASALGFRTLLYNNQSPQLLLDMISRLNRI